MLKSEVPPPISMTNDARPTSRALLVSWGRLHAIRTVLGLAATVAFHWRHWIKIEMSRMSRRDSEDADPVGRAVAMIATVVRLRLAAQLTWRSHTTQTDGNIEF
jgi:hypothetical protein